MFKFFIFLWVYLGMLLGGIVLIRRGKKIPGKIIFGMSVIIDSAAGIPWYRGCIIDDPDVTGSGAGSVCRDPYLYCGAAHRRIPMPSVGRS